MLKRLSSIQILILFMAAPARLIHGQIQAVPNSDCSAVAQIPTAEFDAIEPTPTCPASAHVTETPTPALPAQTRTEISADELLSSFNPLMAVDSASFGRPASVALPSHTFDGVLQWGNTADNSHMEVLVSPSWISNTAPLQYLPEISIQFMQNRDDLIPVQRGLQITNDNVWNVIIEPGKVWSELADNGMSRASFPFALAAKNNNCLHNGIMTFLFDDNTVSNLRYQVMQESCLHLKLNLWGQIAGSYQPTTVQQMNDPAENVRRTATITDFLQELDGRLPVAPLSDLANVIDVDRLGASLSAEHVNTQGIYWDGVLYQDGCTTRAGAFPYCDRMTFPTFSIAKSIFAGLSYATLAQQLDPAIGARPMSDFGPIFPDSWSEVTLNNTLDMSTGHYNSSTLYGDENSVLGGQFIGALTAENKLYYALQFPQQQSAGEIMVYRTSDTFLAGYAMQSILETGETVETDLFDYMVDNVYEPLEMSPVALHSLRTEESSGRGVPFVGYGMFWDADSMIKISDWMMSASGVIDGEQAVSPIILNASLQRSATDRGVELPDWGYYNNGFWAYRYTLDDCTVLIPYMLGYGGQVVTLMPNGAIYFYSSDNGEDIWYEAIEETHKLASHCNGYQAGAVPTAITVIKIESNNHSFAKQFLHKWIQSFIQKVRVQSQSGSLGTHGVFQ